MSISPSSSYCAMNNVSSWVRRIDDPAAAAARQATIDTIMRVVAAPGDT